MMNPVLIGIAGGTGSGKTSLAKRIIADYGAGEVEVIEQDSYYKDLSHISYEERETQNYDHPDSIDIALFEYHLTSLLSGNSVHVPSYDFSAHVRRKKSRIITPHHVIVVEGILVLHYTQLRNLFSLKVFVDTPADIRYIRRLNRDIKERGRTIESVAGQYLKTVRPMHKQFVEPSKYFADIIVLEGGKNKAAVDLLRTKINSIIT
jgi:uridine kinase